MRPMARYLVTGGAGFIGSHIAAALVARGERVRVLDDLSSGREENLAGLGGVELLRGDVTDAAACAAGCEGVAGVFHEAAQVSVPKSVEAPGRSYEINVMGTLRLLEAARAAGVGRFVFAASSAAYGETETLPKVETMPPDPRSPYASGKVAGEHLLKVWGQVYGMRTVALRYFNVFGPRQADDSPYTGVIAIFCRALLEGRRATIYGDGEQTRDFTFVDDVVAANLRALDARLLPGTLCNVGSGERTSINTLYREISDILGTKHEPIYALERTGDVRHSQASLERARELLDWRPAVSFRAGLETTVAWYRERFESATR